MKSFKDISEKLKKDKDDPCWKGYVQLGTKKKNGKEVPNCVPKESNEVQEKAVSKAQQKFMGMVRAKQKGEMPNASPEVSKAAASMSKKDVKDFAKTKHKGLPAKKESVQEAKVSVGDRVTLQPNKSVLDRNLIGKAGVVTNMLDGDAMVKFANGRTIAVSPRHLKINESVELDEADTYAIYKKGKVFDTFKSKEDAQSSLDSMSLSPISKKDYRVRKLPANYKNDWSMKEEIELEEASGKDIAAKMVKNKSMKAFAAKVARMPNVSAGDLEKMLPDYVSGAEIRGLFKEVVESNWKPSVSNVVPNKAPKYSDGDRIIVRSGANRNYVGKKGTVVSKSKYNKSNYIVKLDGGSSTIEIDGRVLVPESTKSPLEVTEGPDYLGDIRRKKEREDRRKAAGHDKETQRQKTMRKVYGNSMVFLKKGYGESVELGEANRNHPAAKKLMALAKQRDAGSDAKDYEKAAQMIMKGDAGQLGRFISRMDSYPRDAVISAVKSTDKAMYDKMVSRMENAEPMNFFEFRETLKEAKGSNYQIYHKTYSDAVQHAVNHVFDKMGYEVDSQDFFNKVSSGPRKPSPGKTNSFSIDLFDKRTGKPVRQKLHMQVYGMDSGKYELNMYVA